MVTQKKYDFKEFEESSRRRGDGPRATITKSGNINFNKQFRDENWDNLEGSQVIFHYDQENQTIGLKFIFRIEPNSYPIRQLPDGKGLVVSARAFLNHNGIPFEKSSSHKIELYKTDDSSVFFIIDLKTE